MIEILDGSWGAPLLQRGPWHESLRYRYITQLAEPYAPVIDNKLGKLPLSPETRRIAFYSYWTAVRFGIRWQD